MNLMINNDARENIYKFYSPVSIFPIGLILIIPFMDIFEVIHSTYYAATVKHFDYKKTLSIESSSIQIVESFQTCYMLVSQPIFIEWPKKYMESGNYQPNRFASNKFL